MNFGTYSENDLSLTRIIQLNKINNTTIDTLNFQTPEDKVIAISYQGDIMFSEIDGSFRSEEVTKNYIIQIVNIDKENILSDLLVKKYFGECCDGFQITTFSIDNKLEMFN